MKSNIALKRQFAAACLALGTMAYASGVSAQAETPGPVKSTAVKRTFESGLILDNQTVMVPVKNTLEFNILHRFGTWDKGYKDLYGIYAPANIALGLTYTPIENLQVGLSLVKTNMTLVGSAKYSIMKQTDQWNRPVSVSYFTDMEIDTRKEADVRYSSDRYMFFHQLLIARKITPKLSVQIAPSLSHVNTVDGYYSDSVTISKMRKHDHFAIAFSARYKITPGTTALINYDQPLTKHLADNPYPNLSLGLEFNTSSHSFQVFISNYSAIAPARNNYFNKSGFLIQKEDNGILMPDKYEFTSQNFLVGFNIGRLWNF